MRYKILDYDYLLNSYADDIDLRMSNYENMKQRILPEGESLVDFANAHEYFGFHTTKDGWVYREWAPGAQAMYLTGDFNDWNPHALPMHELENGVWEVSIPGKKTLFDGCRVQAVVCANGEELRRIPLYIHRVEQEANSEVWNGVITVPKRKFVWTDADFAPEMPPYIYECHVGMAQEKYGIGTYQEFTDKILPRVQKLGYNTIQLMAIMEHPYYASFGYQVTNFFAASSRFGSEHDLKKLVNTAHKMGIRVLLDVVHSHAAKNTAEGINRFDGTGVQFFHEGERGNHREWDTKLFNYGKPEVLHFLLSNLKYWMTEYHFDGFRFDGVTSMLYHDHALGTNFDNYDKYFSLNTDTDAVTYLQLANELVHAINPNAITIAEDMSAMPGMAMKIRYGGIGFDYRLAMGAAPMWIKFLDETRDEDWDIWRMWYELSGRRPHEKVIGYVECHDQALVGDKTVMFRLCDQEMYWNMSKHSQSVIIDRGIALHKMIRWITETVGGEGYLNFMGNEFGHPEWIDFPREGNNWSYHYCRRQWSLADNNDLRYGQLMQFDQDMIALSKREDVLKGRVHNLWMHQQDKVIAYERNDIVFVFNFHPTKSFTGYFIPVPGPGKYQVIMSSDQKRYGGQQRIDMNYVYTADEIGDGRYGFPIYLPSRTAFAMKKIEEE